MTNRVSAGCVVCQLGLTALALFLSASAGRTAEVLPTRVEGAQSLAHEIHVAHASDDYGLIDQTLTADDGPDAPDDAASDALGLRVFQRIRQQLEMAAVLAVWIPMLTVVCICLLVAVLKIVRWPRRPAMVSPDAHGINWVRRQAAPARRSGKENAGCG